MDPLLVATLNIRNLADRWWERLPLLLADMAALQPDLVGLQEVVYVMGQDRLIGAAGDGRYRAVQGWAGRPEYGNSLLVKEPLVAEDVDRVDLGLGRSAHRARVALSGGTSVGVTVTHLHHEVDAAAQRDEQAAALLDWLAAAPARSRPPDAEIVMGDFNADPDEGDDGGVQLAEEPEGVAEDNEVNQKLTKRVLAKLGYHPELAWNGLEALQIAGFSAGNRVFQKSAEEVEKEKLDP
jgi:endonuclease/exonuclease/phosphatase family metal-dependent hydrolase